MPVKEDPRIDKSFRQGKRAIVKTVGALIAELQQLPEELKICGDFGLGCALASQTTTTDIWL